MYNCNNCLIGLSPLATFYFLFLMFISALLTADTTLGKTLEFKGRDGTPVDYAFGNMPETATSGVAATPKGGLLNSTMAFASNALPKIMT